MDIKQFNSLLESLTGHLDIASADNKINFETLQTSIAEALVHQNSSTIRSKEFMFERSDLFTSQHIESSRVLNISKLTETIHKNKTEPETQVFVRKVPVRSSKIPGSITSASAGARVSTIGPIADIQAR